VAGRLFAFLEQNNRDGGFEETIIYSMVVGKNFRDYTNIFHHSRTWVYLQSGGAKMSLKYCFLYAV
jgi:hypothetical protein